MAKKKVSRSSSKVSHWHRHHTVSHHFSKSPFFTTAVILILAMLLAIIWLTLYIHLNFVGNYPAPTSTLQLPQ